MNKVVKVLCLVCLVGFISVNAFGWGNATHIYFAKHLGARLGPVNLQEMYGALTPDMFSLQFDAAGQYLYYLMHYQPEAVYGLASGPELKAIAFGYMTHNNVYGADLTAHGTAYPNPIWPMTKLGWVIKYGNVVGGHLSNSLAQILKTADVPDVAIPTLVGALAPTMGHDLVETAVDILVKRRLDPLVGARMVIAAKARSPETGQLLADAYGKELAAYTGISLEEANATIKGAEEVYQGAMLEYGMAFMMREADLIPALAALSAPVAEELIEAVVWQELELQIDVTVPPELVAENIYYAINLIKHTYAPELAKTLMFVERQLALHHITSASWCPIRLNEEEPGAEGITGTATVPLESSLEQNYPNPFNPSTTISYALPKDCKVTLKIYNSIGQEVATLVDGVESAGFHSAVWNASNLSSGVYFYRMTAGEFTSVKRLTLVK